MKIQLDYGAKEAAELSIREETQVTICRAQHEESVDDLAGAVKKALDNPISYPALSLAVIPEDRVAIALEPSIPACSEIAAVIVGYLIEIGIRAGDICIVKRKDDQSQPLEKLSDELQQQVQLEIHQPEDRDRLAYVAVSKQGEQIMINRSIADADFVIPIGCVEASSAQDSHSIHSCLFPGFSDDKTQKRFQSSASVETAVLLRKRNEEAEEAAYLLGVQFSMQVIPSQQGEVSQIIAGNPQQLEFKGREFYQKIWHHQIASRTDLVIAAISEDASSQNWNSVAKVLALSSKLTNDGGVIALATSLKTKPGPALQQIIAADDLDEALWEIRKLRSDDAIAATYLANILKSKRVFLLSQLEEQTVEELQLGYISSPKLLESLASRSESCVVLCDAQNIDVTVEGEENEPDGLLPEIDHSMDF